MASECEQFSFEICGHQYKMWCKKDKVEQANEIVEKIKPIIEKTANKNQVLSFDKVLLTAMIEILAKEKEFKISGPKEIQPIIEESDFAIKLKEQKEHFINEFVEILNTILKALNE